MGHIRKETQQNYSEEELLRMVRTCLDDVGIAYDEKPSRFGVDKILDLDILPAI